MFYGKGILMRSFRFRHAYSLPLRQKIVFWKFPSLDIISFIITNLLYIYFREREQEPIKVTLEVTGKGLKIVQNLAPKRTSDNFRVSEVYILVYKNNLMGCTYMYNISFSKGEVITIKGNYKFSFLLYIKILSTLKVESQNFLDPVLAKP